MHVHACEKGVHGCMCVHRETIHMCACAYGGQSQLQVSVLVVCETGSLTAPRLTR